MRFTTIVPNAELGEMFQPNWVCYTDVGLWAPALRTS